MMDSPARICQQKIVTSLRTAWLQTSGLLQFVDVGFVVGIPHTTAIVKVRQDDSFVEMGECLLIRLVEVAVKHAELTLGFGTGVTAWDHFRSLCMKDCGHQQQSQLYSK